MMQLVVVPLFAVPAFSSRPWERAPFPTVRSLLGVIDAFWLASCILEACFYGAVDDRFRVQ